MGLNRLDEAVAQYRKILEKRPSAQIYTMLGILEESRGDIGAAETSYRKALEISPETAIAALNAVEGADLSYFYLNPVGLTFQPFKSGSYNGSATRYSAGSQAGSSFNYGAFGNYVVISTSFTGLKAAVALLGL